MSRLSQHKEKQFRNKFILLVIALVVLSGLLFTVGFNLLINSSLFVNKIAGKPDTDQGQTTDDFFGNVNLDDLPTATNSAQIIVSGSVTNYDIIEIYINREKVKEVRLVNTSSFSEEVGKLKKGENSIYARAKASKAKTEAKTDTYIVTYSNEKPKLEIKEPQNDSKVNKQELKVAGTVNKDNEVRINNAPVVIDLNGNFETTINLQEGDNTIVVTVTDLAGNTEKKEIKVTYQKE